MQPVYAEIETLRHLEVEISAAIDKPREWKLEVVGADGKKRKDVVLAYPRLLVPLSEKKK